MMRGLPASGKSTEAKQMIEKYGNFVRLNRDLLRRMLHFGTFSGINEGITIDTQNAIARALLGKGGNLIIDDCNLGESHLQRWQGIAKEFDAKFEVHRVDTDYRECIVRDLDRETEVRVWPHVIYQMALEYKRIPYQKFVLCDIDGTLADATHRLHYLEETPKNWKGFFGDMGEDPFRKEIWEQVLATAKEHGARIILMSGRPDTHRGVTDQWLDRNGIHDMAWMTAKGYREEDLSESVKPLVGYETIIMRRAGDSRPDEDVKKALLEKYLLHQDIVKVFDDRPRVIRMWRELGLDVVDVGNGVEF